MRPIFTIQAGEYLVADHIERQYGKEYGVRVWVPSKDDGIDLLITSKDCKRTVTLQVKFSKSYINVGDYDSSGWWPINRNKLKNSKADYWVFVMPELDDKWKYNASFFLAIPPLVLLDRLVTTHGRPQKYDVYFTRKNSVVIQTRGLRKRDRIKLFEKPEGNRDFSEYYSLGRHLNSFSA